MRFLKDAPVSPAATDDVRPTRRAMMLGLTAGASGLAAGLATGDALASTPEAMPQAAPHVAPPLTIPFHGAHQAGIVTPQPFAGLVASFDVLVETRAELRQLFADLTQQFQFLAHGGTPNEPGEGFPPVDNGLLGPEIQPERLTVTLAVGASLFDDRFGLKPLKPRQLDTMPEGSSI